MNHNYTTKSYTNTQAPGKERANSSEPFSTYNDVLSVEDVQQALGIGRTTAYRLVRNNEIKSIRIGHIYRVPKRYLLDYVFQSCYDEKATRGLTVLKEGVV